jgi:hypothetical protein
VTVPEELAQRVQVVDHRVQEWTDPETGESWPVYMVTFLVTDDHGTEHGLTLHTAEGTVKGSPMHQVLVDNGIYHILDSTGLLEPSGPIISALDQPMPGV